MRLRLIIIVGEARNLKEVQMMGRMNPVIEIECGDNAKVRTEVVKGGHVQPTFNQMLWLSPSSNSFDVAEALTIKARHVSFSSKGTFIGKAKYPLEALSSGKRTKMDWIRLVDRRGDFMGEVQMSLQLQTVNSIVSAPTRKSIQAFQPFKTFEPVPILMVDMVEARDLKKVASWGHNKPFVQIKFGGFKAKSELARISSTTQIKGETVGTNPIWLQGCEFPVCLDLTAAKREGSGRVYDRRPLIANVKHHGTLGESLIGSASVDFQEFRSGNLYDKFIDITDGKGRPAGRLRLRILMQYAQSLVDPGVPHRGAASRGRYLLPGRGQCGGPVAQVMLGKPGAGVRSGRASRVSVRSASGGDLEHAKYEKKLSAKGKALFLTASAKNLQAALEASKASALEDAKRRKSNFNEEDALKAALQASKRSIAQDEQRRTSKYGTSARSLNSRRSSAPAANRRTRDTRRRISPHDGRPYNLAEFIQMYGGTDQWETAQVVDDSVSSESKVRSKSLTAAAAVSSNPEAQRRAKLREEWNNFKLTMQDSGLSETELKTLFKESHTAEAMAKQRRATIQASAHPLAGATAPGFSQSISAPPVVQAPPAYSSQRGLSGREVNGNARALPSYAQRNGSAPPALSNIPGFDQSQAMPLPSPSTISAPSAPSYNPSAANLLDLVPGGGGKAPGYPQAPPQYNYPSHPHAPSPW
eukprot:g5895.t1